MIIRYIVKERMRIRFLYVFFFCASVCQSQNLIQNHSCDSPLVNGNIPFWQAITGTGWTKRSVDPSPFAGNSYFYPGVAADAKLRQEIDISDYKCMIDLGTQYFQFVGYVRSYQQSPSDESNIEIQFLSQANVALSNINLGPNNQTQTWKKLDSTFHVPVTARKVTITLHSVRRNGSNNDGYYDELSLVALPAVNYPFESSIDMSICAGQTYLGHGTSGTYIDTLVAANGCDSIRTLNLTIKPQANSTITQSICEGQTYLGYNSSGTYIENFVAANGCDSIRTLNLTVNARSSSIITQSICEGGTYAGYNTSGTFIDTLIAASGCDSIRMLQLTVIKKPLPNLGVDKELCSGDSLVLSLGNFDSYTWQDNSTSNHFVVKQPGRYSVSVTNACGSGSDEVIVSEKPCNEMFPNAFSPNKDGKNDYYKMLNTANLSEYRLRIYNRFGQKVFETTDYKEGWDGTFNGKPQDMGVYIYYCEYRKNAVPRMIKNTFMLIR